MTDIREILQRRTDLSTFLVHLTRAGESETAEDRLKNIVRSGRIEARTPMGAAVSQLSRSGLDTSSQKCVCFTETPLEVVHLMCGPIDGRQCVLEPYGVAIPKKLGRLRGVNPVWYMDITPGHDWLTQPLDRLIRSAIATGDFDFTDVARIAPYIEQMGTGDTYRKEFWWEREWRRCGDFILPDRVLCLCPEHEMDELLAVSVQSARTVVCIDPKWSLEEIIARLAGFEADEVTVL